MELREKPTGGSWKVVYKRKIEQCGRRSLRCCFCPEWFEEQDKEVLQHIIDDHLRIEVIPHRVDLRTSRTGKKFHMEFGRWSDTNTTDSEIWGWIREARATTRVGEEVMVSVVSIECQTLDLRLFYCPVCGQEISTLALCKDHFRDRHLIFIKQESMSRYFNC